MKEHIELILEGKTLRGYLDTPAGEGPHPLVIFFHGFTGDCTEKKFLFPRLADLLAGAGIASLRLSFLGSGESDGEFQAVSLNDQARQGRVILELARNHPAIDPERIALLGMSMGGCVAAMLAAERQQDLCGLILLAPAFRYAEKYRSRYGRDNIYWHGSLPVGRTFLEDAVSADFKSLLQELRIPVRFFHGTADTSVPPAVSMEFSSYPADSSLTLIDGTDHGFDTRTGFDELARGVLGSTLEFFRVK